VYFVLLSCVAWSNIALLIPQSSFSFLLRIISGAGCQRSKNERQYKPISRNAAQKLCVLPLVSAANSLGQGAKAPWPPRENSQQKGETLCAIKMCARTSQNIALSSLRSSVRSHFPKCRHTVPARASAGAWLAAPKLPPPRPLRSSPRGLHRCLPHSDG